MANILISTEFINDVYKFVVILDELIVDPDLEKLREKIETQLEIKIEAMEKREAFSKYKSLQRGSSEREEARKAYLDKAGIKRDWRSSKELKFSE